MIAILLCAGFGTRMYPLTQDRPKSLLPVAGRPALDYLINQLLPLEGLSAVHVVTNGRFHDQFKQWVQQSKPRFKEKGIALQLHDDGVRSNDERLGANGDLAFVLNRVGIPDRALLAAGDNILAFDLEPIWDSFRASGRNTVIALVEKDRENLQRTGVLELGPDERVVGFHEKPADPPSQWFCPPLYFLNREALERARPFLAQPEQPDAMGHLIDYLIDKVPIYAYKVSGARLDIGSLDSYREADRIMRQETTG
jgi:glucose-1-phosphate thymidylyltransferase